MKNKNLATQMIAKIEDIKSKGTAAIYCDKLIDYLHDVENSNDQELTPIQVERHKADLQNWIETNKHCYASELEMFRSVMYAGQNAIKSSFLLNGGAAIALLAFIGHLAQFKVDKVALFGTCLLPYAYGVLVIAVTSGCTYLSQWFYASPRNFAKKIGRVLNVVSMLLVITSYGLFVWGLFVTYRALINYA
jgi:hypothetical protein